MRFDKNIADIVMKGVCFGSSDPCNDSTVSHGFDERGADGCKMLMSHGEGCEKRDLGRRGEGGNECVSDV